MSEIDGLADTRKPRGAVFVTSPPEHARKMLADVRVRQPRMPIVAFVRDCDRVALGDALATFQVRSDKPRNGRLGFLRELRSARFEIAFAAWEGDASYNPMKIAHLLCRPEKSIVFNPNCKGFRLDLGKDPVWLKHVRWRLDQRRRSRSRGRFWAGVYAATLGALWGGTITLVRLGFLRMKPS